MYVVPSGHFILIALCISLGFALLFEVIEDVKTVESLVVTKIDGII